MESVRMRLRSDAFTSWKVDPGIHRIIIGAPVVYTLCIYVPSALIFFAVILDFIMTQQNYLLEY